MSPVVSASASDLSQLLDRHAEAMGYSRTSLEPRALHVKAEVEGFGLKGQLEAWTEPPLAGWTRIDLGILSIESGYDGKEGWLRDRNGAIRDAEANELAGMLLEALLNTGGYVLEHPQVMLKREQIDVESGAPAFTIQVMGAQPQLNELDPDTYRLARTSWNNGQFLAHTWYEDYRRVDERWMAHRMRLELGPSMEIQATANLIEFVEPRGLDAYRRPEELGTPEVSWGGHGDSGELDMVDQSWHVVIRGQMEGRRAGWFLLDTGAGSSIINGQHLDNLGLSTEGQLEATGAAGTAPAQLVNVPELQLGNLRLPEQSWVTLDLGTLEPMFGVDELQGILGYDTLVHVVTHIDYDEGWVRFYPRNDFRPPQQAAHFPLRMDQNIPSLQVEIEGIGAWVHVDTGSDNTLDLTAPFVESNSLLNDRVDLEDSAVIGVGGRSEAQRGRLRSLRFGQFQFEDLPTSFNLSEDGIFGNTEIAGVLGSGVLSNFELFFDYEGESMWILPGRGYENQATDKGR